MFSPLQNPVVQLLFGVFLVIAILSLKYSREISIDFVSRILNIWLCYRYPIRNQGDQTLLPTCSYRWPNGQGNVAKFLEGRENSFIWEKKYGSCYRIWSGMASEVVLTRPEHIQAVFKDSDKHFKAIDNNSGYLMREILGQCVGLISLEPWRRVKAVAEMPFLHSKSKSYGPMIEQQTQRYFDNVWENKSLSKGLLNPAEDLKLLPFLIVANIIYGDLSPEMEQQLLELAPQREALFKYVIRGGLPRFTFSKYLPTAANRALFSFQKTWTTFNATAHERALTLSPKPPIVQMYAAVTKATVTIPQLHQTLDEMLFANLDVTLGGISWTLVFLAAHKSAQTRLRTEIVAAPNLPAYLSSSSSFLSDCILESARLRPLAAFSVPQSAPTPRLVSNFLIPAGTNFVVDSYALNVRNPYWGADRTEYRPERWLERKGTETRYNYWRFGFGPRQCMGKYVADAVIRALVVHLVKGYDLGLVEKQGEEWKRNGDVWIDHPEIVLRCVRREGVGST